MPDPKTAEDTAAEVTELEKFEAERVDGVTNPANGFPVLMLKALPEAGKQAEDAPAETLAVKSAEDGWAWYDRAGELIAKALADPKADRADLLKAMTAGGELDEQPDIDGGQQAIALIAKLIGYEAQELEAGRLCESYDISLLTSAVDCLKCWLSGEQMAQEMADATKSAEPVVKADKYNAEELKQMVADGRAMRNPNGDPSYPIADEEDLDNAVQATGRGKSSGNAIRRHVTRRAKAMGMSSKIPGTWQEDGSLASSAKSGQSVDAGRDKEQIESLVSDAVTKATKGLEERLQDAQTELAKVKATPIPGGPVMSIATPPAEARTDDRAAKAAYYRDQANAVSDPETADGYRQLARKLEEATPTG